MGDTWLSVKEVTDIENCTKRTIRRRIQAGYYKNVRQIKLPNGGGKNGLETEISLSCLSEEARAAYYKRLHPSGEISARNPDRSPSTPRTVIVSPELAGWQNKIASARFDLVSDYIMVRKEVAARKKNKKMEPGRGCFGNSICAAAADFIEAYNTGLSHPDIFAILGRISRSTLDNWARLLKKNNMDFAALAPRHGQHRRGNRKVTQAEMDQMLRFALAPNGLRISQVIRWTKKVMAKEGVASPSSKATLRRAMLDWKRCHLDRWVFCREGEKALDDKVAPYTERDSSRLQVGDVLVADGHKLNFQVINPFTGKPGRAVWLVFMDWASRYPAGWYCMFTENIECIHAALRRSILNLGKIPKCVLLDNGRAFKARVFTGAAPDFRQAGIEGLYARLGIETAFAIKYNAKAKPVERFFGTFNELERLLPSYTGASIKDKPAHMRRNEKLHKKLHNPFVPTVKETESIISAWITEEYAARPHRGIRGAHPGNMWDKGRGPGVDPDGLRYLMMTHEVKAIHRNGITMFGINYYDEALYGYRERVLVRYDILDMGRIYVYAADGREFICEATPMQKVHPMARLTGNPLDLEAIREGMRLKKKLTRSTEAEARQAAAEIGPWNFPGPIGPAQDEGRELTRAEIEKIDQEASKIKVIHLDERRREPEMALWDGDTYERLLVSRSRGHELTADQEHMMAAFEETNEYRMLRPYYERVEEEALLEGDEVENEEAVK